MYKLKRFNPGELNNVDGQHSLLVWGFYNVMSCQFEMQLLMFITIIPDKDDEFVARKLVI